MKVHLVIGDANDDQRLRQRAAYQLGADLRRVGIVNEPVTTMAPAGTKSSAALAVGELVVQGVFSATTVNAVARIVIAFVRRGSARSVKIRLGEDEFVVAGPSPADQRALVDAIVARLADSPKTEEV